VLDDLWITEVFDEARAGDARAKPPLDIDDDVADAAYRNGRVRRAQPLGPVRSRARNRYELLVDTPPKLGLERTGTFDAQCRRLQIVDRERRTSRRSDAQRLRREFRYRDLDVTAERKRVQRAQMQRDGGRLGATVPKQAVPPAPAVAGMDGEAAVGDRRRDRSTRRSIDVDRFGVVLNQQDLGDAADLDFVKRRKLVVLE
jgi:hypothetical protein